MNTKNPEDQAKKAFPVWLLIALLFTLVWLTGFLWLKQANKEVTETHKTRAVTIPIELQDKSCVLTIPACELELRTPEKISLANRANIDLKINPSENLYWDCNSEIPKNLRVQLFARIEFPAAKIIPTDQMGQEFPAGHEASFHWTIIPNQSGKNIQGQLWLKAEIIAVQTDSNQKLEEWSLFSNEVKMTVIDIGKIPTDLLKRFLDGILLFGCGSWVIFILQKTFRKRRK